MDIAFVRTAGQPDRVYVTRTDGTEVSWSFPTYGDGIPHDLVHLVVETAFGLKDGFWGRVDRGIDVARLNHAANRRGGADKYAGFGPDQKELWLAELLAGTFSSAVPQTDEAIAATLAAQAPTLAPVPVDKVKLVRQTLARLAVKWRGLVPKGSIVKANSVTLTNLLVTFAAINDV